MSGDTLFVFHSLINFGLPLLFCWHQLRSLRRDRDDRGRDKAPEPRPIAPSGNDGAAPPKALPDCLVPRPSPFLPGPRPAGKVLEEA